MIVTAVTPAVGVTRHDQLGCVQRDGHTQNVFAGQPVTVTRDHGRSQGCDGCDRPYKGGHTITPPCRDRDDTAVAAVGVRGEVCQVFRTPCRTPWTAGRPGSSA